MSNVGRHMLGHETDGTDAKKWCLARIFSMPTGRRNTVGRPTAFKLWNGPTPLTDKSEIRLKHQVVLLKRPLKIPMNY